MIEKIKSVNGALVIEDELTLEQAKELMKEITWVSVIRWDEYGSIIYTVFKEIKQTAANDVDYLEDYIEPIKDMKELVEKWEEFDYRDEIELLEKIKFSTYAEKTLRRACDDCGIEFEY